MQAVIDRYAKLSEWIEANTAIKDIRIVKMLAGGNSNETALCSSSVGPLILRHPPVDVISDLASAGIAREFRFISAVHGKAPVPEPVIFCDDQQVIGAPFALTRFVDGVAITETLPETYRDADETVNEMGRALIAALANVHNITDIPESLGHSEKARQFVPRQIERWRGVRAKACVRDLPDMEILGDWLALHAPEPEAVRIVHCDYHLDNVLMDHHIPKVNAILDWEMATLADPMVDLGLVTAMWNRDENQPLGFGFVQRVSNRAQGLSGADLAQYWAELTGLSIKYLYYFQSFALWRLAAIVEGAYVLFKNGKVDGAYERGLEQDVPALLDAAKKCARQFGEE